MYQLLGCNKTDVCRWRQHPYSTQQTVRLHKLKVIQNAARIFSLNELQTESLANTAGLSLYAQVSPLPGLLQNCSQSQRRRLYHCAVSERMLQYYLAGRQPSKQALLAILILLEYTEAEEQLQAALNAHGYCLSHSLANDIVVRWFLFARPPAEPAALLNDINITLHDLQLPLLMTRQSNRKI